MIGTLEAIIIDRSRASDMARVDSGSIAGPPTLAVRLSGCKRPRAARGPHHEQRTTRSCVFASIFRRPRGSRAAYRVRRIAGPSSVAGCRACARRDLAEDDRRHAAGLMRVNHTGEVCAQALYAGQALTARDPAVRRAMAESAKEEEDHLAHANDAIAERLPEQDGVSRAIIEQMREDEARHGETALEVGGVEFPAPVRQAMALLSKLMTETTYRV